ncbi:hypothetical protein HMPREF9103_01226 [Lentilactobacillus parafarraginis F0439]|uniref:Uncharacterized protein n=1 Tax=Lentilactobacillus parafarraginis F0439 TaxID=797515 RepID=G9ZNC3_9LACO|nr:hypothetical protein HMPREF9103_01226 [Lentilactobacillus parafarraginis F0439]
MIPEFNALKALIPGFGMRAFSALNGRDQPFVPSFVNIRGETVAVTI